MKRQHCCPKSLDSKQCVFLLIHFFQFILTLRLQIYLNSAILNFFKTYMYSWFKCNLKMHWGFLFFKFLFAVFSVLLLFFLFLFLSASPSFLYSSYMHILQLWKIWCESGAQLLVLQLPFVEPWIQASTELELRNANLLGELAALETKHQYVADHLQECQQVCNFFWFWWISERVLVLMIRDWPFCIGGQWNNPMLKVWKSLASNQMSRKWKSTKGVKGKHWLDKARIENTLARAITIFDAGKGSTDNKV